MDSQTETIDRGVRKPGAGEERGGGILHPAVIRSTCRLLIFGTLLVSTPGCKKVLIVSKVMKAVGKLFGGSDEEEQPAAAPGVGGGGAEVAKEKGPTESWEIVHPQQPYEMKGVPADETNKELAIRPREGVPKITLSNVRTKMPAATSLDPIELSFDYVREGEIPKGATFRIRVKIQKVITDLQTSFKRPFVEETKGTIRVRDYSWASHFAASEGPNLGTRPWTVWVEMTEPWHQTSATEQVSNSISFNGAPQQHPREWNELDHKKYELYQKWLTPLPGPPAGYSVATASTKLIPGMPILEASTHDWLPSEVLDLRSNGKVLISSNDLYGVRCENEREWIAVQDSVLRDAQENPGKFTPSVRLLPDGNIAVPEGYVAIDGGTKLYPGTLVEWEYGRSWHRYLISEVLDDQRVRILTPFRKEENEVARGALLLSPKTVALLELPEAEKVLAGRLERARQEKPINDLIGVQETKIESLPSGMELIPQGLVIPEGTKLSVKENANDWEDVEFLGENWDGRYYVRTLGSVKFEGAVDPEQVAISTYELAKLSSGKSPTAETTELRNDKESMEKEGGESPTEPDSLAMIGGFSGRLKPVLPSMNLMPGVPVKAKDQFDKTNPAMILKIIDEDQVEVAWDGWRHRRGETVHRSKLLIDENVEALLDRPGYAERFASGVTRSKMVWDPVQYMEAEVGIRLPIPSGAVKVTDDMPLCAGAKLGINSRDFRGRDRWWDVTVLGVNWNDTVLIHIDGESDHKDGEVKRSCLIITQKELKRLEEIAGSKGAAGGSSDSSGKGEDRPIALNEDVRLVPGVPVLIDDGGNWKEATVIRSFANKGVIVLRDELAESGKIEEAQRSKLRVRPEVIEALKVPENEAKFQARVERIKKGKLGKKYPAAQYPVKEPLPRGAVRVTEKTPLIAGTKLGMYLHVRWMDVTVEDLNWDGSVRISFDDKKDQEDGDIDRSSLIIAKPVLEELEAINKSKEGEGKE